MHKSFPIACALFMACALVAFLSNTSDEVISRKVLTSETASKGTFAIQSVQDRQAGGRCYNDDDCAGDLYCLLSGGPTRPAINWCYECINSGNCKNGDVCDSSSSSAGCTPSIGIDEVPSIDKIEHGYNNYKGDPLYLLGKTDPGYANGQFYHQRFDTNQNNKVTLEKTSYSHPVGIDVQTAKNCMKTVDTNSMTTSESYQKAVQKQVSYGASGTYNGVELGGNTGTGSYKELSKNSMESKTTIESSSICSLFTFNYVGDPKKTIMDNLTDAAVKDLKKLGTGQLSWGAFFDLYGTHMIVEGEFGAFERISLTFTEEQRNELTITGKTFEDSVSIGMPGVFGLEKTQSGSESEAFEKSFREMKSSEKSIKGGDIEDLLDTPGLITKQLEPICEFIEDSGLCYRNLKAYCIAQLKEVFGSSITECNYPKADVFHCSVFMDCEKGHKCDRGQCVAAPIPSNSGFYCAIFFELKRYIWYCR